jgi:hypothetical protein
LEAERLELFAEEEERRISEEGQRRWLEEEKAAQIRWREHQARLALTSDQKAKTEVYLSTTSFYLLSI